MAEPSLSLLKMLTTCMTIEHINAVVGLGREDSGDLAAQPSHFEAVNIIGCAHIRPGA